MKKQMKKICVYCMSVSILAASGAVAQAHSGRTDSSGGHHDYNNVSGLGSYHYHHGYGPHLHPDGVCPYSNPAPEPDSKPAVPSVSKPKAKPVSISNKKATLVKGQQKKLKIKNASGKVKWSSSNKKIAKVNSKGAVTAKSKGKATITATVSGKKYKCKISVEVPNISNTALTLKEGDTSYLKMYGTKQHYTWKSSDNAIVSVDYDGKISAEGQGIASVYTKIGGVKYICKVKVIGD